MSDSGGSASADTMGFGADASSMIERVLRAMGLHRSGDFAAAAAIYREVLERYPDHPDVVHYLGMTEYQLGNKEVARGLLQRSIALDGRKAIVHVNLGRIDLNDRQAESAIPHFERALSLDPQNWEAEHMLGRALLIAGQPYDAVTVLERAAARRPGHPKLMLDLAYGYGSCRRHPAAVTAFKALLAIDPGNPEALGGLAHSLRALNRPLEALHCLEQATATQEPRWLCELGGLREELGEFDVAARLFGRALEIKPNYPVAVGHLLALRKGAEDPGLVAKAAGHLAANQITKPVRVQLEFALGRHFDAAGDFDQAFAHYRSANEIVTEGRRYRPLAMTARVDELVRVFDRALMEAKRPFGNPSDRPLFVVGMPRSGTTLTEQILASHHDVAGAGELGFFSYMAYELARKAGRPDDQAEYARSLGAPELADCSRAYLAQLDAVSRTARRVVDKMPLNFLQLGLIALTFPNARVVHCRRDPLDTCLSCYFENFHEDLRFGTTLEGIGHFYGQYERLMKHWRAVLELPILEMRYEDTVVDVEMQARRLIDFCGLPWDEACLDFHRTDRAVSTPSRWQVRQPIYSTSVRRWLHYEKHLAALQSALQGGS